jgi:predicted transcriptional regulator of viral defense system
MPFSQPYSLKIMYCDNLLKYIFRSILFRIYSLEYILWIMSSESVTTYGQTLGTRLLKELADRGLFVFTSEDAKEIAAELEIPQGYISQLLSKLAASDWIVRLRRGLYAGTGSLPGGVEVHPFAIATHLVSPSAVSGWSALHYHGLTEQVPQTVTASTPKKVVTPSMRSAGPGAGKHAWEVGGVRYEYVTIPQNRFFGIEEVWVDDRFKVPIYDQERALLDCFALPRHFGSLAVGLGILEEHLDDLDVARLVSYALRYGKASVTKRLGWALERVGAPRGATSLLAEFPMHGARALDPTRPREGNYDARWMVIDNLGGGR